MKNFLDIVYSRKSIRSFASKSVPRNLIQKIVALGTQAPTNCNQQLWNVVVIEDEKMKKRLVVEAASNTLLQRAPVVLVVTYDGWSYKESIQGASLMVGHMLLAAEYYGLGALPINSYGSDQKIKRVLQIPDSQIICCFVVLGYPDDDARIAAQVERRPVSQVLHYGQFTQTDLIPFTYNPEQWSLSHLRAHQQYYSRKTVAGKEMDIMSGWEQQVVAKALSDLTGPIADLFSYDGAYLSKFPSTHVTTFDLTPSTVAYSQQAVIRTIPKRKKLFRHSLYSETNIKLSSESFTAASIMFKLERISKQTRINLFRQIHASLKPNGELIIISRARNPLLVLFFWLVKFIFGSDVRKTGLFAFFGPYTLISPQEVVEHLHQAGFISIQTKGYFPFPAIFERYYQMLLQYIASDGSSYIHRLERRDIISSLINVVLKIQGLWSVGWFGSVVVIQCRKSTKSKVKRDLIIKEASSS